MKTGDIVVYTENGESFLATVLEVRELDHHMGENDEPLVHLGFFTPVMKPGANGKPVRVSLVGTHDQYTLAQFRLDVAHESHEFPAELKVSRYPGGRWRGPITVAEKIGSLGISKSKKSKTDDSETVN
jgi:hypothetical protein